MIQKRRSTEWQDMLGRKPGPHRLEEEKQSQNRFLRELQEMIDEATEEEDNLDAFLNGDYQ